MFDISCQFGSFRRLAFIVAKEEVIVCTKAVGGIVLGKTFLITFAKQAIAIFIPRNLKSVDHVNHQFSA